MIDPTVIIGIIFAVAMLFYSIGIESGIALFFSAHGLIIVLGGTLGATLVHFPVTQLLKIGPRLKVIFSFKSQNYNSDIQSMIRLGEKLQREGRLALSNELPYIKDHFLRHGLQLLVDKVPAEEIETLLKENIEYMKERHEIGARFFDQMGRYAPSFGLLATLIGLITMLSKLSDPKTLGPSMGVGLIGTFYGVLTSNLIFLPLAGRLRIANTEEVLQKYMLLQGLTAIARGESSYLIREKMSMILPQNERKKIEKAEKAGR